MERELIFVSRFFFLTTYEFFFLNAPELSSLVFLPFGSYLTLEFDYLLTLPEVPTRLEVDVVTILEFIPPCPECPEFIELSFMRLVL